MKAILEIELVAYTKPIEENDGSELYFELTREIDIPFAPSIGLDIALNSIPAHHPDAERFERLLEQAPEPVLPLFRIESVRYNVDDKVFILGVDCHNPCYESPEAVEMLVEQLVLGYGFRVS